MIFSTEHMRLCYFRALSSGFTGTANGIEALWEASGYELKDLIGKPGVTGLEEIETRPLSKGSETQSIADVHFYHSCHELGSKNLPPITNLIGLAEVDAIGQRGASLKTEEMGDAPVAKSSSPAAEVTPAPINSFEDDDDDDDDFYTEKELPAMARGMGFTSEEQWEAFRDAQR